MTEKIGVRFPKLSCDQGDVQGFESGYSKVDAVGYQEPQAPSGVGVTAKSPPRLESSCQIPEKGCLSRVKQYKNKRRSSVTGQAGLQSEVRGQRVA